MTNQKKRKLAVCFLCAVGVLMCGLFFLQQRGGGQHIDASSDAYENETEGLTFYDGAWYAPKEDLDTILIMGLDKFQNAEDAEGYRNDQQSDFLLLLVMDRAEKTCSILHINRDTMTEIPILGVTGNGAGSMQGQLALAHTYGSGQSDSCINTLEAVSNLLYGMKIDHYVSMTMDAVAIINDLTGGVTVHIEDDFSGEDSSLVQGQDVCLTGDQALTYVRARGGMEDSSNLARMERQRQYLTALYEQVKKCTEADENFLVKTITKINGYLVSDCTVNQMAELGEAIETCEISDIQPLDGEAVKGEEFMEFYVDEASLQKTVMELFYEAVEDVPDEES